MVLGPCSVKYCLTWCGAGSCRVKQSDGVSSTEVCSFKMCHVAVSCRINKCYAISISGICYEYFF